MRTKTVTFNVYKFSELSEKAKSRAKYDHFASVGYSWDNEAMGSIKALAAHFNGKVSDWQIDWWENSYSSMKFDMPDMEFAMEPEEQIPFIEKRLAALGDYDPETLKGTGECKLTGVCFDEDAIDGFRIAFVKDKESDLNKLMQAAFGSWLKACQADAIDATSDENYSELSDANDYKYTEDGKLL